MSRYTVKFEAYYLHKYEYTNDIVHVQIWHLCFFLPGMFSISTSAADSMLLQYMFPSDM